MATYEEFKFKIIWHLFHRHYIGGKHTAIENVASGLPTSERGACMDVADDLIKEGWLVPKKTGYGLQVSLNKRMIKEIKQFLIVR